MTRRHTPLGRVRYWDDEAKHIDPRMFQQCWPPTPQVVLDAVNLFGEQRAIELSRRAHTQSVNTSQSFEACMCELIGKEQLTRAKEAERMRPDLRPEPFSFRLKGWPRRGL